MTNSCINCGNDYSSNFSVSPRRFSESVARTITKDCSGCQWVINTLLPTLRGIDADGPEKETLIKVIKLKESPEFRSTCYSWLTSEEWTNFCNKYSDDIIK